ncbi:MAG: magnesium transporter, partial [Candidatus Cloacimonadaceae bacterium]
VVNMLRIWITSRELKLGITVSIAMFFTVLLANIVGATLPLIARKFKMDPAIMASPVITTIVDAMALIIYFQTAVKIYGITM